MSGKRVLIPLPLLVWASVCCALSTACADELRMRNKDHLKGTIVSLDQGLLRFVTSYAGEISIAWKEVVFIKTNKPAAITVKDGQELIGWLETSKEGDIVCLSDTAVRTFSHRELLRLRPLRQDELRRPRVKPLFWTFRAEAGAQYSTGKRDSLDTHFGFNAHGANAKRAYTGKVTSAFREAEGTRTAQNVTGEGRLELHHTKWFFTFYQLDLEHDDLEDLILRSRESVGVGYKFIETSRTHLRGEVGFGAREELFDNDEFDVTAFGRLGIRWKQKISAHLQLEASLNLQPDLINLGEYRAEGEASLISPIAHHFRLRFGLTDQFNSAPQPGIKQNELTLRSSLVWSF